MKFLLALAILFPLFAAANDVPSSRRIGEPEASRFWRALKVEANENGIKKIEVGSMKIECSLEACEFTLGNEEGSIYFYRDENARALYAALELEEFAGRVGFTKIIADPDSGIEILCSRFASAEGDNFSCTVSFGD